MYLLSEVLFPRLSHFLPELRTLPIEVSLLGTVSTGSAPRLFRRFLEQLLW